MYFDGIPLEDEARGIVHPRAHLLIEHVEALAVGAEELHLLDVVGGVHLLLRLLLDEPVEELHGAEVL